MPASMLSLASLWRYPIKSMMGEELNSAIITDNGILGDRSYALLDLETDKIVSAKNPKKWPEIFSFHARYIEAPALEKEPYPFGSRCRMVASLELIRLMPSNSYLLP
jgi:uncharacterized protein YcbX